MRKNREKIKSLQESLKWFVGAAKNETPHSQRCLEYYKIISWHIKKIKELRERD